MFSKQRYHAALVKLGGRVSEGQRRMLATHANAPAATLDVLALARAAGQSTPNYTYSQYGRLGHLLAHALGHRFKEYVWTRLVGRDTRHPTTGRVQWRMHGGLADAVRIMGWTSGIVTPTAEGDVTAAADALADLDHTTREALVEARLKQGEFRRQLVVMWGSCAVTGCGVLEALTASHIKPWRDSDDRERLDVHNGLLLLGTLDRLFDAGLITFDPDGTLRASDQLSSNDQRMLGLRPSMRLRRVDKAHLPFLKWHRNRVFVGYAAEQRHAVDGAARRR